ncbi:hypothetical protein IAS59_000678 [Cryptococcus gattii]
MPPLRQVTKKPDRGPAPPQGSGQASISHTEKRQAIVVASIVGRSRQAGNVLYCHALGSLTTTEAIENLVEEGRIPAAG